MLGGVLGMAPAALLVLACGSPSGQLELSVQPTARLSHQDPPMLNILPLGEQCAPYVQEELLEPVKVYPRGAVLETQLIVALKHRCVPVFVKDVGWTKQRLSLRTYGFPRDHADRITAEEVQAGLEDANMVWSAPGPTFVLHKATAPGNNDGTNFRMTLYNALPPQADPHACDEMQRMAPRPQGPFQVDTAPNCFHGDNSTNFHYHGSHVSPQPHQDFVGLELLPFGATAPEHPAHGARGEIAIGSYDYDIDPLRYTQAEGTHWYHAHKHGSTALQVLNGLVGTLEVRGAFDEAIESLFAGQQTSCSRTREDGTVEENIFCDRLMVVQQLQENPSGLGQSPSGAPLPLINGQANPVVKMKPGEVQRWRFVGATMQASAQLDIRFPDLPNEAEPQVRQIAMDGVQFAPENYRRQPILNGPDGEPGTTDDWFKSLGSFRLSPGSRIDFLVQAPQEPGRHLMTFEMSAELHETVTDDLEERIAALVQATNAGIPGAERDVNDPPLLTLEVSEGSAETTCFPCEAQFPTMPAYLADIPGPYKPLELGYEMNDKRGNLEQVRFAISVNGGPGRQYDPSCVNETVTLDVPEEWTLTNNSSIAHPFHIHTNPFQMISELTWVPIKDAEGKVTGYTETPIVYQEPYIWRDTLAIPTVGSDPVGNKGEAVIRYVAREFTGEFVNHCHILGHEDRGMMHNVQAVCPEVENKYGKPTRDLSPECREGNYIDSAPICSAEAPTS